LSPDGPRLRLGVIGIVTVSLFAALFSRLWFLQVIDVEQYNLAAENNRVRTVIEQAPRGRIYDRNGTLLVGNRRTVVVGIDFQAYTALDRPDQQALLERLADELVRDRQRRIERASQTGSPAPSPSDPTTVESLEERLADPRFSHFKPVPVAQDVTEDLEIYLREKPDVFPAVHAERVTVRTYEYGQLLAHVLGYVGSISETELLAAQNATKPYEPDDEIGKTGVEAAMERELRGIPGETRVEVDARNRPVRSIGTRRPVPGNDVFLTIDVNLQAVTEQALEAELLRQRSLPDGDRTALFRAPAGSSLVLDPNNGQVLALASYPTYEPAAFINGISTEAYRLLTSDELKDQHHYPLTNRALQGQYAPGSTFKLATAYSALSKGLINPGTTITDTGTYQIQGCRGGEGSACVKQNAGRDPKGVVNLSRALTVSSDVYFYKVGDDFWVNRNRPGYGEAAMQDGILPLGFGEKTGVDIGAEMPGRIPTPQWKKELAAKLAPEDPERGRWRSGDSTNVAIGQGDVLVTPLQLANAYATFANGGTLYRPQFVLKVTRGKSREVVPEHTFEPQVIRQIELPPAWRRPMLDGFKGVTTQGAGGTAATTFAAFPQDGFKVAGKTGTAQVNQKQDTSLFIGFAPADAPRYVVVAVLEESGNGGNAAAPLVRRIFEPLATGFMPPAPLGGRFDAQAVAQTNAPPPSGAGD
jgi:penicillin-binding protein 2